MKLAITAKRVVILMMAMALAVAMVACTGAAGTPGPAGPKGDPGEQGEPGKDAPGADQPVEPADPVEPGPVQMIKAIDDFVFDDTKDGMDTMAQSIDVSKHFHPSGLMYSLGDLSTAQKKRIDATLDADTNTLTVMLKAGNSYQNDMLTVTATDGESSKSISFYVRRNRNPVAVEIDLSVDGSAIEPASKAPYPITVWIAGTQDEKIVMAKDDTDDPSSVSDDFIRLAIGRLAEGGSNSTKRAFFQDDAGNKLTFTAEALSTKDSKKLMVTGGDMKVVLLGKKSTSPTPEGTAPITTAESGIAVHLLASDGSLKSDDSVHVLNVKVDTPPALNKKAASISTKVITLNTTDTDATISVGDILGQFQDDRQQSAGDGGLEFFAWSEDDTVAEVTTNPENKKDKVILDDTGENLVIIAQKPGATNIMIKAKEKKLTTATTLHANMGQTSSETLKISVIVEK